MLIPDFLERTPSYQYENNLRTPKHYSYFVFVSQLGIWVTVRVGEADVVRITVTFTTKILNNLNISKKGKEE